MELYYKDLISKETSLEKLVDDLTLLVQGANELAEAAGASVDDVPKAEIANCLGRLKESCQRVQEHAVNTALAADKVIHHYPYSSMGFAFAAGLLIGALVRRRKR